MYVVGVSAISSQCVTKSLFSYEFDGSGLCLTDSQLDAAVSIS